MPIRKAFQALFISLLIWSCSKDDKNNIVVEPPRLLSEVAPEDEAALQAYLQTHFYNYEEFDNPPADFDYKIRLDTIAGVNSSKRPLIEDVESLTVKVSPDDLGLDEQENVDFTLYYLIARDGAGMSPTIADSTFLKYEGSLLTGNVFDAITDYRWQYLPFFIRGFSQSISKIRVGTNIQVNPDGTSSISDAGIGVMFLPSGLAYFDDAQSGIPAYSPLIFKVSVGLYVPDTDYDGDGVPSIMEDLNGDGNVTNDNTDEEVERRINSPLFPNHLDPDDDGDGILTRDEIIVDEQGNITFPDDDNDGIPNYLDIDS